MVGWKIQYSCTWQRLIC